MKKGIIRNRDWCTIICIFSLACPIALNSILVNAVERVKVGDPSHTSAHKGESEPVGIPHGQRPGASVDAANHPVQSGLQGEHTNPSDPNHLKDLKGQLPGDNQPNLQVVTGRPPDPPKNVDPGFNLTDIRTHHGPRHTEGGASNPQTNTGAGAPEQKQGEAGTPNSQTHTGPDAPKQKPGEAGASKSQRQEEAGTSNSSKHTETDAYDWTLGESKAESNKDSISRLCEELSKEAGQKEFIRRLSDMGIEDRTAYSQNVKQVMRDLLDFVSPDGKAPDNSNISAFRNAFDERSKATTPGTDQAGGCLSCIIDPWRRILNSIPQPRITAKTLLDKLMAERESGVSAGEQAQMRAILHELACGTPPIRTLRDKVYVTYPETLKLSSYDKNTQKYHLSKLLGQRMLITNGDRKIKCTVMNLHYYAKNSKTGKLFDIDYVGLVPDEIFYKNASLDKSNNLIRFEDGSTKNLVFSREGAAFVEDGGDGAQIREAEVNRKKGISITNQNTRTYEAEIDETGALCVTRISGEKKFPIFIKQETEPSSMDTWINLPPLPASRGS